MSGGGALPSPRILAGGAALLFATLVIGGAFAGLLLAAARSPAPAAFDTYLWRVAGFTLFQAALSVLVSVVPGILVARALFRLQGFRGRTLVLGLFAVPLGLPALVAALGILALLGRAGLAAGPLGWLMGERWPGIYGLSGILVAHAFFNMPLAARLFLGALEAVPADQWRLAAQLGLGQRQSFRLVEWPALRASLPGVAGLVFMLCVSSFTIVLTLGGGPAATTLEVAVYQALRFDFDPARAVLLTVVQAGLVIVSVLLFSRLGTDSAADPSLSVSARRFPPGGAGARVLDRMVVGLAILFVGGPIASVVWSGLQADLLRLMGEASVQRATVASLMLAAISGLLATAMAWALAAARHQAAVEGRRVIAALTGTGVSFALVIPPVVIGAGWFVTLLPTGRVFEAAPVMVAAVNALMAVPFALRVIRPAFDAAAARHDRLALSLGIGGWNRLRLVDWPALRRPLLTALAFGMALSLGDLGVIALFGSDALQTLPSLLFARLGSYRTADAAGLALLLGSLCLCLMLAATVLGQRTDERTSP
ncbi:MAG: thiamine/thiamine pyrophosphate ABC transporter, permease protein [Mesorhizobium amorphae]|nr:MAG: thiamine/thiamine pyrophosphate ABC transporter, permease protein [Mesorhizobium amorphae]